MEEKITQETKERYTVWMMPSTREEAEELMQKGNCKRISEFIEKAVMIDNNLITLARLSGYVYSSVVLFGLIKERGNTYGWQKT